MNLYSTLLYYIKAIAGDSVAQIYHGLNSDVDMQKITLAPILNIDVLSGSFTNGNTCIFNVELACLQFRDYNKEILTDYIFGNDNMVDNLNETHAILNELWLRMIRDFDKSNITASENPQLDVILMGTSKLLDGWLMRFDVEMPNNIINICST